VKRSPASGKRATVTAVTAARSVTTDPSPDLIDATTRYEAWVDGLIPTVQAARSRKHALMAADPFSFFRGTYYRWAERVTVLAAQPPGPQVLAVGDLHVENFGTWRDAEGRTVWGVNDLDEADRLPAAYDLMRLATSALLAQEHAGARMAGADVVAALLNGYGRAVALGGLPIVLDRPDPLPIGPLLPAGHAARWWSRLLAQPIVPDPDARAVQLLLAAFPDVGEPLVLRSRLAGMGSREHLRIVATRPVAGAPAVREVKALTPPATWWLHPPSAGAVRDAARTLGVTARRSPDTSLQITDGWVVRRLAPWADRIELADLHRRMDAEALLRAMGAETANLHLASAPASELTSLTSKASARWLASSASRMLADTVTDWLAWRGRQARGAGSPRGAGASPAGVA
jgi:hypothetical protein